MMHPASASPLRSRSAIALAAAALPALAACGGAADSASDIAADSSEISSQEVAFIQVTSDGLPTDAAASMSGEALAQVAATQSNGGGMFLRPAGCLTATAQGATVTYQLHDCTGPWGLVHVTGTATATYAPVSGGLHVTLAAAGLRVNGATVELAADATITGPAGARVAQVSTQSHGTSARGIGFSRSGNYTASWDGTCLGLTGTFSTEVARVSWSTAVSDVRVCRSECPQSGSVAVTGSGGRTTTVAFSGGASATVTGAAGRTTTVRLFCGGN